MSRVRVLYVQHAASPSGAAVSLGIFLRGLDQERFEPILACTHPVPEIRRYYEDLGVPVVPAERIRGIPHTTGGWLRLWNPLHMVRLIGALGSLPASVRATERLIDRYRPDLVHLNSLVLVPAAMAARRRGIPLVWHVREHAAGGHFGLRRWCLSSLVKRLPDAAIFLSRVDMQRLGSHPSWSVIPNPVLLTTPPDRGAARRELRLPEDGKVVLFLGGYSLMKGVETLLRSLPSVAAAVPTARCLIVGAHGPSSALGPRLARAFLPMLDMATPRQKVERALVRVRDMVTVLPWSADVDTPFAAADVLAFPALQSHFPRPVIEALTKGVPVVASDLDGIREAAGEGCRLVPPGDPAALSSALVDVLTDEEEARVRSDAAVAEARSRYDPEAHVRAIEDVYDRVLADRAVRVQTE